VAASEEPVGATPVYLGVFAVLAVMTCATVGLSLTDLGLWRMPTHLAIAAVQASMLSWFFMHLNHANRITWLVVGSSLFFLGLCLLFILQDYVTRHWAAY
jgi:caa(3)-type oxidase subunit IV